MLKAQYSVKRGLAEAGAERVLARTLEDVPFVNDLHFRRNAKLGHAEVSLLVTLRVHGKRQRFVCDVRANGQPRTAREACLRLLHLMDSGGDYPVFIAPFVSAEASAVCFEMGVGFIDLAGNCRLTFDGVYVQRYGHPNPSVVRRALRSLYSPKAERVLRVLVTGGRRQWKTQELADEARVSLGQVANVKKLLADREWIDSDESGFGLLSFDRAVLPLVKEWSENCRLSRSASADFYSMKTVPDTESSLVVSAHALGGQFGFTAFSGAARFQPIVRYQKVAAYYIGDPEQLADRAGLKRVSTGANVTVFSPYDEGVFYGIRQIDQAPIISPVQLYLDLQQMKGRGEEAAAAILDQVIAPLWR